MKHLSLKSIILYPEVFKENTLEFRRGQPILIENSGQLRYMWEEKRDIVAAKCPYLAENPFDARIEVSENQSIELARSKGEVVLIGALLLCGILWMYIYISSGLDGKSGKIK